MSLSYYVLKSWGSEATSTATHSFKRSYKILPDYNFCLALGPYEKVLKSDIQSGFSISKINLIFQIFLSEKAELLGEHYLFNFWNTLLSKIMHVYNLEG